MLSKPRETFKLNSLNPILKGPLCKFPNKYFLVPTLSDSLFFGPPKLLFHLGWKGVENGLFHDEAAALELFTLSQLDGETLDPVPSELQLSQVGQLAKTRRKRLQVVITQVQCAQLLTFEQL